MRDKTTAVEFSTAVLDEWNAWRLLNPNEVANSSNTAAELQPQTSLNFFSCYKKVYEELLLKYGSKLCELIVEASKYPQFRGALSLDEITSLFKECFDPVAQESTLILHRVIERETGFGSNKQNIYKYWNDKTSQIRESCLLRAKRALVESATMSTTMSGRFPSEPFVISENRINEIKEAGKGTKWDVEKLCALISEFNDAFAKSNAYSCVFVLRAILDHLPPLFGFTKFSEVANNYSFSSGKKLDSAKKLIVTLENVFRHISDEQLHSQIDVKVAKLELNDLTSVPPALGRLLEEAIKILERETMTSASTVITVSGT